MSERTEFLRTEALKKNVYSMQSVEGNYNMLKGYFSSHPSSNIIRRALAKAYELKNATPVIDSQELIVGKPYYNRQLTENETTEYETLKKYAAPAMIPLGGQSAHMTIDYEKLLSKGIKGIIEEINDYQKLLDISNPEDMEKNEFYIACITSLDGLVAYSKNYSNYALSLAENESNVNRKKELEAIAKNLSKVPEYPADTFYEAIQSVHFVTFCLEGLFQLGRPDRYLLQYYKKDISDGTLTREMALELITCVCILFNEYIPSGLAIGLMVGGRDKNGNDITNELSYLFLESIDLTRMIYPAVNLCHSSDTPQDIMELCCALLSKGYSHPAIFNDDIIIKGLMYYGLPYEHACEYIHSTCVEITPIRNSAVWVASPYINLTQILLDVIKDENIDSICTSYDTLEKLYIKHLGDVIRAEAINQNRIQMERHLHGGDPLVSCFVNDCLALGKDIDAGGATYNWIMPSFVGMANLADSLLSLKTLVFDNKELDICSFYKILESNFEGNEPLRQKILNKIDKYGNDIDSSDEIVKNITSWILEEMPKYKTYHKDKFIPSLFCWIMHEALGNQTIATPDGRMCNFPFGDGSGPAQGREKNGPTASVLSSTKWNHYPFIGGIAVNLKFNKTAFNTESLPKLLHLINTYLDRGGFEIQINIVDQQTLIDAQQNPEKYRDLVVRIGGYSDYFTRLSKNMQNEVILRTEHTV